MFGPETCEIICLAFYRAILHDEQEYPDLFTFNPDRFLTDGKPNPDVKDPSVASFGCKSSPEPCEFSAELMLWISSWQAYSMPRSSLGIFVHLDGNHFGSGEGFPGVKNTIYPCKCNIQPRSEASEK